MDRYVKDKLLLRSVKFSPNGRLLATGASDHQIRVFSLNCENFNESDFTLDMGHHTKPNARRV